MRTALLILVVLMGVCCIGCQGSAAKYAAAQGAVGAISTDAATIHTEIAAARPGVTPAASSHLDSADAADTGIEKSVPAVNKAIAQGAADAQWKANEQKHWFGPRMHGAFWTILTIAVIFMVVFLFASIVMPMLGGVWAEIGAGIVTTMTAGMTKVAAWFNSWLSNRVTAAQATAAAKVSAAMSAMGAVRPRDVPTRNCVVM